MSEEIESLKHSYRLLEEERERLHAENERLWNALTVIADQKVRSWWLKEIRACAKATLEGK